MEAVNEELELEHVPLGHRRLIKFDFRYHVLGLEKYRNTHGARMNAGGTTNPSQASMIVSMAVNVETANIICPFVTKMSTHSRYCAVTVMRMLESSNTPLIFHIENAILYGRRQRRE
jgi:hypothetical protein